MALQSSNGAMGWLGLGFALALAGGCDVAQDDFEPTAFRGIETSPLLLTDGQPMGMAKLEGGFKLEIDGLPTNRVAKIDAFSFEQNMAKGEVGMYSTPSLTLTVEMADWDAWAQWFESFVIDGECTDSDEKSGSLTFLGPDMQEELMAVHLDHLGIISLEQEAVEANAEGVARFTVELYCEQMFIDVYAK